jgi:hypothetical protein
VNEYSAASTKTQDDDESARPVDQGRAAMPEDIQAIPADLNRQEQAAAGNDDDNSPATENDTSPASPTVSTGEASGEIDISHAQRKRKNDGLPAKKGRRFPPADAQLIRYLDGFGYFDPFVAGDSPLVGCSHTPSHAASSLSAPMVSASGLSRSPSDSDSMLELDVLLAELMEQDQPAAKPRRKKRKHSPVTLPAYYRHLKPKKWRDTGAELRTLFFHRALARHPHVKAFSLRLNEAAENTARASKDGPSVYVHNRLKEEIGRSLKRAGWASQGEEILFWVVIEEDRKGALHAHGEIAFHPIQRNAIRAGMKVAAGEWLASDKARSGLGKQFQLRFADERPDVGWAGYCTKDLAKATPIRRRFLGQFGPNSWVANFDGKALSVTNGLRAEAEALYEQARADAIAAAKAEKAASRRPRKRKSSGDDALLVRDLDPEELEAIRLLEERDKL